MRTINFGSHEIVLTEYNGTFFMEVHDVLASGGRQLACIVPLSPSDATKLAGELLTLSGG